MLRILPTLALLLLGSPLAGGPAAAATGAPKGRVYLTVDEALELAFPKCRITRETTYLSDEELARAEELAGFDIESGVVRAYEAHDARGVHVGTAYFDSHRVRTLKETLMVVVDAQQRIQRIEILAFGEPEEYLPRGSWYAQFTGKPLNDELSLKRGIRGVSGATLTARATTDAARRVLALHGVVQAREG